jgi:rhomboid family protein
MFPIRDHNPSQRTPWVTRALIAVNIAVFLATWPLAGDAHALSQFYGSYALIPARVFAGQGGETFLTSMFLHAGFMHLAGNMLFLWIFGDNLEDEMGHTWFLTFYLAGGLVAGFAHFLSAPASPVPLVGASGAIAAVMGGYLLMFPRAKVDVLFIFVVFFRIFAIPAWIVLGGWFLIQLYNGLGADADLGGVAWWAHAGGFVTGLLMALPLWIRRGGAGWWRRTRGVPQHPEKTYRSGLTSVPQIRRRR